MNQPQKKNKKQKTKKPKDSQTMLIRKEFNEVDINRVVGGSNKKTNVEKTINTGLLLFSCSVMFDSLRSMDCSSQHTVPHHLPELAQLMSIGSVMPSNHLVLCCPLILPSVFPGIRVFSNELDLHIRCPKYWSFSFRISLSSGYSGLISFRIYWLGIQRLRS